MSLTKGQLRALRLLLDSDDKEIICDGLACMIDLETISRNTVNGLLAHMAIKDAGYAGAGCEIFIPTQEAGNILTRPALADEMVARVLSQKPFYVDESGMIRDA